MSLINDALKRADRDQQTRLPTDTTATLQPVHYSSRDSILLPLVFVLIVALAITGSLLIWKALTGNSTVLARENDPAAAALANNPPSQPVEPAPVEKQLSTTPTSTTAAPAPVAEIPQVTAEAPALVVEVANTPVADDSELETAAAESAAEEVGQAETRETAAPEPDPEPTFPELNLEGIVYHPQRACVMVNGKSIFIGERVNGATLIAVQPDSATFEFDGQQKELFMP